MIFDNRSLVVAVALVMVLCAAARFLLHRMHPAMPGLARWAWASVLGAVAMLLFAADPHVPALASRSLSQVLILAGFVLSWDGFRRFLGRRPVPLPAAALIMLAAAAPMMASQALRSAVASVLIAMVSALMARELLRAVSARRRMAMRALAAIYVLNAAFFLARGTAIMARGVPDLPLQTDAVSSAALLWALAFSVATTLGMVLMAGERLQEELDHQISRDPLTGALNRRAFGMLADKAIAHCRRQGLPLALLAMDLDRFKQINDRLGHGAGDLYLCRFVAVAATQLRAEDVLGRFGGEEFLVLMPGATVPQALAAAERLREAFARETADSADLPVAATVSIGVAGLAAGETLDQLFARADRALYLAKHNGRDRCETAPPPAPDAELSLAPAL